MGNPVGLELDSEDAQKADIQNPLEHVLDKEFGQTSRYVSFSTAIKISGGGGAIKFTKKNKIFVAQQLQYYDDKRSVDALSILLLQDEDVYVRIFAADSLLKLNRSKLQNIWEQALEDESTYVTEVAKKAIADLQNSEKLLEAG